MIAETGRFLLVSIVAIHNKRWWSNYGFSKVYRLKQLTRNAYMKIAQDWWDLVFYRHPGKSDCPSLHKARVNYIRILCNKDNLPLDFSCFL